MNLSSLSEAAGLEAGDLLLAVNGEDVESRRHKEAQDRIVRCGNNLTLTVRRGSALNEALKPTAGRQTPLLRGSHQAGAGDWDRVLQSNKAGAAHNAEDFTQEFMNQLRGGSPLPPPPLQVNHNGNGQNIQTHLTHKQRSPVRMSTPTKQVSEEGDRPN